MGKLSGETCAITLSSLNGLVFALKDRHILFLFKQPMDPFFFFFLRFLCLSLPICHFQLWVLTGLGSHQQGIARAGVGVLAVSR